LHARCNRRLQGGGLHELATMVQRSKQAAVAAPSICQQLAFLDAETKRGRAKRWAVNPFDNGAASTAARSCSAGLSVCLLNEDHCPHARC
jgi:hypothetical protein